MTKREEIIENAAKLAGISVEDMAGFCEMADDSVFEELTAIGLRDQYLEYIGE